jgi:hypothetical protein
MSLIKFFALVLVVAFLGFLIARVIVRAAEEPRITEGHRLLLESTQLAGSNASAPCAESVNKYVRQRQVVTGFLESEYPGWTPDWTQLPATLKAKQP